MLRQTAVENRFHTTKTQSGSRAPDFAVTHNAGFLSGFL
jgi:hypothetical protein